MASRYAFHGTVFTGIGKGAYYVGHPGYRTRMLDKLGYEPYPGTLNLKLHTLDEVRQRKRLRESKGVLIESFELNGERFSGLNCFAGVMNGRRVTLLIVEITRYDDSVIELISRVYLRGELGLKDGDRATVTIQNP